MTTIVLERQPLQSAFTVAPEREQANTILQLNNIAKSYDHKSMVLNDINLSLQEGEFVSIIGQSGAGNRHYYAALIE